MVARALAKGILSLLREGKKIREIAMKLPHTADYVRRAPIRRGKIITERKGANYRLAAGDERYDKFLKDFSKQYKTVGGDDFSEMKKGMVGISPDFWLRTQQNAKNKGLITLADTRKVQHRASKRRDVSSPQYQEMISLRVDKRNALLSIWKDITNEAPRDPSGVPILSKNAFYPINTISRLKKKFPELFNNVENDRLGRRKIYNLVEPTVAHDKLKYPKFRPKLEKGEEEQYMARYINKFTGEPSSKIDRQYWTDVYRSRPPDFRTGVPTNDAPNFLRFVNSQGALDPTSPYFFRKHPEYIEYAVMRKAQRPQFDLSHTMPSLNPEGYFPAPSKNVPFGGGDPMNMHFLGARANQRWQPTYEKLIYQALKNREYHKIPMYEKEMIKRNIVTKIMDPYTGKERVYGGWKEFGFSRGGIASLRRH